ncbi:APH domain-containing protein [Trichoderma simmonsii]|uniref:APH domain-containing protein n=1 Tax=Trichoderma simmonsii TaxID=1491479 RepID=A0A8G0LHP4_9HYPO|nr:APH domain-containing protein [Trichoderma simmonsii]
MSENLLTEDEGVKALLAYIFSGSAIGPMGDKGVGYSLLKSSLTSFSWSAALEDFDGPDTPVDRYLITIDRRTKKISTPEPIVLSETELADAILSATGQHLYSWARFTDGSLSISYKVTVEEDDNASYVIQLRHHGYVASMDSFMTLISRTIDPSVLPIPPVYPIPGEETHERTAGMGRQITQYIPGTMASSIYPQLSHKERLIFVQKIALAFSACWEIQLPEPRLIGELIASNVDGQITLRVGPDRHDGLGGPFDSVRGYLREHIKSSLIALEKQQGIEEYKDKYLHRIREIVNTRLQEIPAIVEKIPIVAMHTDMGPHNIIVSSEKPTEIQAIIDWEFLASAPYASHYRTIEMFSRKNALSQFGPEYECADELREAFWNTIPNWKQWNESEATQTFLEWFKFGLFMKAERRPEDLPNEERESYWAENIRVVEGMFDKYSPNLNEASNT